MQMIVGTPEADVLVFFCARKQWREELHEVFLAGPDCFMESPSEVAKLLHWKTYHEHWPDIPEEELKASAVNLRIGDTDQRQLVLLHKRRVSQAQADGDEKVFVCSDCHDSFRLKIPQLCKFSLANHMWIGRWDPLFRMANIAHQMLCSNYNNVVENCQENIELSLKKCLQQKQHQGQFLENCVCEKQTAKTHV